MEFEYAEEGGLDEKGRPTPAYGFVHESVFVFDPFRSSCGRFPVNPYDTYGLTAEDCIRLVRINRGMGVAL